jgi:rhodanese-related sulfurtransferase
MFGTEDLLVQARELPRDALLVDVREPYEWEAGHVEGSRHVPLDLLAEAVADLPGGRPIVLICLGGARAAMCAAALRTTGLNVLVLEDGLRGWVAAGHSLHRPTAYLAPHGRPPAL